jgi:hypothetical protein
LALIHSTETQAINQIAKRKQSGRGGGKNEGEGGSGERDLGGAAGVDEYWMEAREDGCDRVYLIIASVK